MKNDLTVYHMMAYAVLTGLILGWPAGFLEKMRNVFFQFYIVICTGAGLVLAVFHTHQIYPVDPLEKTEWLAYVTAGYLLPYAAAYLASWFGVQWLFERKNKN